MMERTKRQINYTKAELEYSAFAQEWAKKFDLSYSEEIRILANRIQRMAEYDGKQKGDK